jgi:translocation protein SEC63
LCSSFLSPYEILHLDKTASDQQIKRAYRKQSLQFHPDHNSSPEAAQQFMLVAKAHEALTSETAKKNIEKYGNPDGYQGVSVTIGLPSLLTRKENEMRVLVVYFLLFIVLPPIAVWVWWRRAREFVDGGTMKKTLAMWAQVRAHTAQNQAWQRA